jgi:Serine dehydrogenase proteinase
LPGWGEILNEVNASAEERGELGPDFDGIRDRYLRRLHELSGRAVISYASGWLQGKTGLITSVTGEDVHGFMEVCRDVEERELDLLLHSPGGSPEAAEQIVEYLRTQFDYIRCFVPLQAKSAATMIALGCDEIVMGNHSELGPIDAQIFLTTPEGVRQGPAHGILRDFQRAQRETRDELGLLPAWTPILRSYIGGLIEACAQLIQLSMDLVRGWLERYMLRHPDMGLTTDDERAEAARSIAESFGSDEAYDRFRTHGRPIRSPELATLGLRVRPLEDDDDLQDAVLSIFHATTITFNGAAAKIIENHLGRRFVKIQRPVVIPVPGGPPGTP